MFLGHFLEVRFREEIFSWKEITHLRYTRGFAWYAVRSFLFGGLSETAVRCWT